MQLPGEAADSVATGMERTKPVAPLLLHQPGVPGASRATQEGAPAEGIDRRTWKGEHVNGKAALSSAAVEALKAHVQRLEANLTQQREEFAVLRRKARPILFCRGYIAGVGGTKGMGRDDAEVEGGGEKTCFAWGEHRGVKCRKEAGSDASRCRRCQGGAEVGKEWMVMVETIGRPDVEIG